MPSILTAVGFLSASLMLHWCDIVEVKSPGGLPCPGNRLPLMTLNSPHNHSNSLGKCWPPAKSHCGIYKRVQPCLFQLIRLVKLVKGAA